MEGDDLYFRSDAMNIFSYGDVLLQGGKGAVIDGGKFGEEAFDNVVNFFYRKEAGSRAFWAGGVEGDDGWGSDYVKTKITEVSEADFRNGTLLSILNAHPTGKYPDGSPRWVQGENYPELWVFRKDLPKPEFEPDPEPSADPGEPIEDEPEDPITPIDPEPEDPINEPENPIFEIEDGDGEEPPAVIVPLDPEHDVTMDTNTGVETVAVPEGALTPEVIAAAVEAASEAGTEPAVVIKIDTPIDAATGEPAEVREVWVKIHVGDLIAVADSDVENVRIVSGVGEITLNTDALIDLIAKADEDASATVEIVIAKDDEARLEELTPEQQETLSSASENVREVYDISVVVGNSKIENFETGGKLTLGLPYALEPGEVGDNVLSVYIAPDGSAEPMRDNKSYSDVRGLSIFRTNHLSVYAVTYETAPQAAPPEDEETTPRDNNGCDAGFGAFGMAILALGIALTARTGKPVSGK
jgi:hypothetical protein